jgi:glycosyltransferase involved in cell wall biosynthesis
MPKEDKLRISVVVPVYNEERALERVLVDLHKVMRQKNVDEFEIITVNDGSTDNSLSILKRLRRKKVVDQIVDNHENRGYGYSLKMGIKEAKFEWVLTIDSDGGFSPKEVNKLIRNIKENDMVVGARVDKGAHIPIERIIPKKIVALIAIILTGKEIPDINSGLRVFKKSLALEFWHLYPNGFSLTTTITLAALMNGYSVSYVPVKSKRPLSKSSIKSVDFFYFVLLVIRLVVYYQPLRFFFWPGVIFIALAVSLAIFTLITENNITDTEVLVFITGIQTMFFGLIADLIVKTREKDKI